MSTLNYSATDQSVTSSIPKNKVLKNTYLLLSATLFFSAVVATFSAIWSLPHPGLLLTLGGYFALLYLTNKYRNSGKGLICVFALTGFMGYTLGPIIGTYWAMAPNIVVQAMAGTAIVFTTMSVIAVRLKRDLSNLAKTLFVGILVAFLAGIGAIVFEIPALSLAVSAMFVVLMSAMILYQTNQILHGGESNYIMATVSLYVALFNLFTSLLHLLGFSQLE